MICLVLYISRTKRALQQIEVNCVAVYEWLSRRILTVTILFFKVFSAVFAVFSTPYHLFSNPPPQLFLYAPPIFLNFLYLPYSTPIGAHSLLLCQIHPFSLYERCLQPAHTSPPAYPPGQPSHHPARHPPTPPLSPTRPAITPPPPGRPDPPGPPPHRDPHLAPPGPPHQPPIGPGSPPGQRSILEAGRGNFFTSPITVRRERLAR